MTFSISTGQLATAPKVHESLGWGGGGGVSHYHERKCFETNKTFLVYFTYHQNKVRMGNFRLNSYKLLSVNYMWF